jgi:hypothetical protein
MRVVVYPVAFFIVCVALAVIMFAWPNTKSSASPPPIAPQRSETDRRVKDASLPNELPLPVVLIQNETKINVSIHIHLTDVSAKNSVMTKKVKRTPLPPARSRRGLVLDRGTIGNLCNPSR